MKATRARLEALVRRYHKRSFVHPDPLEFLYRYERLEDREVAGFVAASLAYGRVAQILASVERALAPLGPHPARFLAETPAGGMNALYCGFVHRFCTDRDLACLLSALGGLIRAYGSLGRAFAAGFDPRDENVQPSLARFVCLLNEQGFPRKNHLVADPEGASAVKRLHLFLRWMVRRDCVDPGGWDFVPRSRLIVPLDVHMLRQAQALGLTARSTPDLRTALDITGSLARFCPEDPVKYDFSLTRPGILSGFR
ncbi:MAG: TIGR02757 family protein [Thermodesulfobacteriota bacterium]